MNDFDNKSQNFELDNELNFNFDKFDKGIEEAMEDLEFLQEEKDKIVNPDALGEAIKNVVWQQFITQIGIEGGKEFDLKSSSHIQNIKNFENGKIADHNCFVDYQKRYNDFQNSFERNASGEILYQVKNGKLVAKLKSDARREFDMGRDMGSKTVNKDHTIPVAELLRDPETACFIPKEDQIAFANSYDNLKDLDSAANQSKGDLPMKEWLEKTREGKTPDERFNINKEQCIENDEHARKKLEEIKKQGEQDAKKTGKKSQRIESLKAGRAAVKSAVMVLMAGLLKNIIGQFVKWIKSKNRSFKLLSENIKEAIHSFVSNLKSNLLSAAQAAGTTILTAIVGPVLGVISKIGMMLKQGWSSLKEAITYLKNPDNKSKPMSIKILEIGKIITAGVSATEAIVLGEVIEKGLLVVNPAIFGFEIPIIGSLANIIGIFLGAVIAGIVGAIVLHLIDKALENKRKEEIRIKEIELKHKILKIQDEQKINDKRQLEFIKNVTTDQIIGQHEKTAEQMRIMINEIEGNQLADEDLEEQIKIHDEIEKITKENNEKLSKL